METILEVWVCGDPDYKDDIAECYVNDVCVMIVSQEAGPGILEVEFVPGQTQRIKYTVLLELLQRAQNRLWALRRNPEPGTGGQEKDDGSG
jgi:hypothetical protein